MGRQIVRVLGQDYTKTGFEKKWSEVVQGTECNYFVKPPDSDFVHEVVLKIEKWKGAATRPGIKYKIRNKKFQGRAVRGIVMITPRSKREIWLGKGKIVDELFPRAKPIPEYKQNKKDALVAMRQIIEPQIVSYRKSVLRQIQGPMGHKIKCALSGQVINAGEFHIDHRYPFKNIVEEFCRDYKLDLENVEVYCRGTKCYLKDTQIAEAFFDYHMMNASLQAVMAKANLKKGSKYYG